MKRQLAWAFAALLLFVSAPRSQAQDAADLLVRVNRLEGQLRQLSGQIEQLQFQNRRLEERLQKFEQDVEFRFQDLKPNAAARPASGATPAAAAPAGGAQQRPAVQPAPQPVPAPMPQPVPQKRGDAFDPTTQPNAPGAPRILGSVMQEPTLPRGALEQGGLSDDEDGAGPLDLSGRNRSAGLSAPGLATPGFGLPSDGVPRPVAPIVTGSAPAAPLGAQAAREEFDVAVNLVQQRQYDKAEMALRQFLQANPRDRLAPEATYWLGETYYRRALYPDAVEQYLKVYKTFGTSRVAPESLLKLSMSLRGMGQPEQACATLGEIGRKYPTASAELRANVERESRRGNC